MFSANNQVITIAMEFVTMLPGIEIAVSGPCDFLTGRLVWDGKRFFYRGKLTEFYALLEQWKKRFQSEYKVSLHTKLGYNKWMKKYTGKKLSDQNKCNIKKYFSGFAIWIRLERKSLDYSSFMESLESLDYISLMNVFKSEKHYPPRNLNIWL